MPLFPTIWRRLSCLRGFRITLCGAPQHEAKTLTRSRGSKQKDIPNNDYSAKKLVAKLSPQETQVQTPINPEFSYGNLNILREPFVNISTYTLNNFPNTVMKPAIFTFLFLLGSMLGGFTASCNQSHSDPVTDYINHRINPIQKPGDISRLCETLAEHRLVLLGEATHGTLEFYAWRAHITRNLISRHGFRYVAVEGDWASIYRLNAYVKGKPGAGSSAIDIMRSFNRWPQWMWANETTAELIEWMREYNLNLPEAQRAGFYGMDVYGQWEAFDELMKFADDYLDEEARELIRQGAACFDTGNRDDWGYARAYQQRGHNCDPILSEIVAHLESHFARLNPEHEEKTTWIYQKQNARVVNHAENFFRLAVYQNQDSWNSRVSHMWKTVKMLDQKYGSRAGGIVWAHNTHVGDAAYSAMSQSGMENIGQLSRNEWGNREVFILGFGTYSGKVNAGSQWGSSMQIMQIPEAMEGSIEHLLSHAKTDQFYWIFDDEDRESEWLSTAILNRAIGVVYNPFNESGNYVPTIVPRRYDGFLFVRNTHALKPVRQQ